MSARILLIQLSVMLAVVYSLPVNHEKPVKRSAGLQAEEVTDKLSKLKSLLEKLETGRITKTQLADHIRENANTKEQSARRVDKSGGDSSLLNSVGKESAEKIINMKTFLETLTPKELQKLKMIRELMLENAKSEDMVNEGSFANTAVDESKEKSDVINWKDLAKRLENERDDLYLQQMKEEDTPVHIETETKEGTFGAFRDEIKYAVEKNLLTDVALAMHSGISVDEILADLTAPGNDRSHDSIWAKRDKEYAV